MIKKLVLKSGINPKISSHSFRRSFATFHHRQKVPIENI